MPRNSALKKQPSYEEQYDAQCHTEAQETLEQKEKARIIPLEKARPTAATLRDIFDLVHYPRQKLKQLTEAFELFAQCVKGKHVPLVIPPMESWDYPEEWGSVHPMQLTDHVAIPGNLILWPDRKKHPQFAKMKPPEFFEHFWKEAKEQGATREAIRRIDPKGVKALENHFQYHSKLNIFQYLPPSANDVSQWKSKHHNLYFSPQLQRDIYRSTHTAIWAEKRSS